MLQLFHFTGRGDPEYVTFDDPALYVMIKIQLFP